MAVSNWLLPCALKVPAKLQDGCLYAKIRAEYTQRLIAATLCG